MEYKLKDIENEQITLEDFAIVNEIIHQRFPSNQHGKIELKNLVSATYQIQDDSVFMNYRPNGTTAWIPTNAEQVIYEIESRTKLKLTKN